MKTAVSRSGEVIIAGAGVQDTATCQFCGCKVTLRKRRLMGGGVTYFWRHVANSGAQCPKRSGPHHRH